MSSFENGRRLTRRSNALHFRYGLRRAGRDAERSAALKDLNGRLDEKSWLLQKYFGDRIPLLARFLPFDSISLTQPTRDDFAIRLHNYTEVSGPEGVQMYLGFVPLVDLYGIYSTIGRRFLERNIRFTGRPIV